MGGSGPVPGVEEGGSGSGKDRKARGRVVIPPQTSKSEEVPQTIHALKPLEKTLSDSPEGRSPREL